MKVTIAILLLVAAMFSLAVAQRGSYLPRPISYPQLSSRFQEEETGSTQQPLQSNANVDLNNRVGETATTTTIQVPVDALGDTELVNRISQWPRDKQPFWYLNSQHLEANRHSQQQQPQQPIGFQTRSSFLGSRTRK